MSIEKAQSTETKLIKVSRHLKSLSRCVHALFNDETELEMLQSYCEILLASDELSLVWVGYYESSEDLIRPIASAGAGIDYFEKLPDSSSKDKAALNPVAIALKTGEPCCVNDIAAESQFPEWRTAAVEVGHASSLAIPLTTNHKRHGNIDLRATLHLCSRATGFFDDNTIQFYANTASYLTFAVAASRTLLSEGLSSGIAAVRARQLRQKALFNLEKMREELARVTRLGEMGQISAYVAHEIKQPLAAIVTNADAGIEWLSRSEPNTDEARDALMAIVNDGKRASEVAFGIHSIFKKGHQSKSLQNVNEAVQEVLTFVSNKIEHNRIVVRTQLEEKLPTVLVNRVQLQQVILNLVGNAIEAMSSLQDRERLLVISSELVGPRGISVIFKDTGVGIEKDQIEQIFEPFFTTKSDGIGVGLAICRSIIESHDGSLLAERGYPYGSVFTLLIPVSETT